MAARRRLDGKVAIVTGSTSGYVLLAIIPQLACCVILVSGLAWVLPDGWHKMAPRSWLAAASRITWTAPWRRCRASRESWSWKGSSATWAAMSIEGTLWKRLKFWNMGLQILKLCPFPFRQFQSLDISTFWCVQQRSILTLDQFLRSVTMYISPTASNDDKQLWKTTLR